MYSKLLILPLSPLCTHHQAGQEKIIYNEFIHIKVEYSCSVPGCWGIQLFSTQLLWNTAVLYPAALE